MSKAIYTPDPFDPSAPLNQGRAFWALSLPGVDGGPSWRDIAGGHNGTATSLGGANPYSWSGTSRPGGFGQFNFTNAYLACGRITGANAFPITLTAWVYPTSYPPHNLTIFGGDSGQSSGLVLRLNTAGRIESVQPGVAVLGDSAATVPLNTWSFVGYSASGSAQQFWLNGQSAGESSVSPSPFQPYDTWLGWVETSPDPFLGAMDDLSIYPGRTFSGDDFAAMYTESLCGYPTTLRRLSNRLTLVLGSGTSPGGFKPWFATQSCNIGAA